MFTIAFGAAVAAGLMLLLTGTKILQEYERGVVFRFGRARKALASPGFNLLLPFGIDRIRVVDTRTRAIQITPQDIISHDNITISVDAVVYASVNSPSHAILEVEDFMPATLQLASTTLRAVLGKMDLDDILAHRDKINVEIRNILDTRTEQWGVEISAVEIKDIQLPKEMQRAMARQAEAERERRAKVIAAEGEVQAAAKLAQAAQMIAGNPGALQLRLYQTLVEVAGEASSTIVFPVPIDLGMAAAAPTAAQTQAMMASALALASNQQTKQLGAQAAKASRRRRQRVADAARRPPDLTAPAAPKSSSAASKRAPQPGADSRPGAVAQEHPSRRTRACRRRRSGRRRRASRKRPDDLRVGWAGVDARQRRSDRSPAPRPRRPPPATASAGRAPRSRSDRRPSDRGRSPPRRRTPGRVARSSPRRSRWPRRTARTLVSVGGVDRPGALGQRQDVRRSGQRRERRAAVGRPEERRRARDASRPPAASPRRCGRTPSARRCRR